MSNIDTVIGIVTANPEMDKAKLVELVIANLGVTKSNAQVYVYNARKKINGPTRTVKIPKDLKEAHKRTTESRRAGRLESVQKSDEEIARIKADRIDMMKAISERRRADQELEREAKREEMVAEMSEYNEEADAFVKNFTSPFLRKLANPMLQ